MSVIAKMMLVAGFTAFFAAAASLPTPDGGYWPTAQAQPVTRGPSGLPLPRFVSLKASKINVRRGPGRQYGVLWQFRRAGLPVEIIQEFDNWRKIRDADGDEGWIFHSLLSGERTAIVAPWAGEQTFALRTAASEQTAIIAYLQARVISQVVRCDGDWCRVRGKGYDGWIGQDDLWGVYPSEQVEGQ